MKIVAEELISIRENNNCSGWEKLNCSACSKYSWYQNIVHIESAIHISFGKMQSYDRTTKSWLILPLLRIEVNPNKHAKKKVFKDIMQWIRHNCTSGTLKKYDYAIDVFYSISKIAIYNSKKEPGLYKGTIYRGQRSQHGFLKIYDKSKEQGVSDKSITRIEHTLDASKPLSLEKIVILQSNTSLSNQSQLDNLNYCIVTLCLVLQTHGIDFEPYIAKLNYRRRRTIEPYLYGNTLEVTYSQEIIDSLLDNINLLFNADLEEEPLIEKTDFQPIDESIELPFD